jgi:hypothetical protein
MSMTGNTHPDILKQLYLIVHISDVRQVAYPYRLICKQRGTKNLQSLVLGSLGGNLTF